MSQNKLNKTEFFEILKKHNFTFAKVQDELSIGQKTLLKYFELHSISSAEFEEYMRENIEFDDLTKRTCCVCLRQFTGSVNAKHCSNTCQGFSKRVSVVTEHLVAFGTLPVPEELVVAKLKENKINYSKTCKMFDLSDNGLRLAVERFGRDPKTLEKVLVDPKSISWDQ